MEEAKLQTLAHVRAFLDGTAEVALLAEIDALHSTLSGTATKKLMVRPSQNKVDLLRFKTHRSDSISRLENTGVALSCPE